MAEKRKYIIGSRGSSLALWQAQFVQWLLSEAWPEDEFEIKTITTSGDNKEVKISEAGGKGLFIKELEESLLRKEVDICVHCMKDLPTVMPEGCSLASVVERGEVRDVLISRNKRPLAGFTGAMKLGTSSLRRKAQLRAQRVTAEFVDIRGNVDTRIEKLEAGEYEGIILAAAGVLRLGLENLITEYLDPLVYVPAPGQGAIGIECRAEDDELRLKLRRVHHDTSGQSVTAERAFLKALGGSCVLPLGAWCQIEQFQMRLAAYLSDRDGATVMMDCTVGPVGHSEELGQKLAERFLNQGARRILDRLQ